VQDVAFAPDAATKARAPEKSRMSVYFLRKGNCAPLIGLARMDFEMDRCSARESPGGSRRTSVYLLAAATESVIKRFLEQEETADCISIYTHCLMSSSIKEPPKVNKA
jgi:hypothetical protein